jgi:hypothetical protein
MTALAFVLAAAGVPGLAAPDAPAGCLDAASGALSLPLSGAVEAILEWSGTGLECQGMPRPDEGGVRLMFSHADDAMLVVLGVTGLERGETARGLAANLTLVREGAGEFYGTLGGENCNVDVRRNERWDDGPGESWRVSGIGRCPAPVPAIGREGVVRVAPFSFDGVVDWTANDR